MLQSPFPRMGGHGGTQSWPLSAALTVFFLATTYAFCVFTLSREVVIPALFGGASGLIPGDPQYYDQLARLRAVAMKENGLASFVFAPDGQGIVGILSLVYFIAPNYGIVVLNASLHGLASMTMFLLLRRWFSSKAAVLGVLPVFTAPYMMAWFSGPNKDIFVLVGGLLLVYGVTGLHSGRSVWGNTGVAVLGTAMTGLVKPYLNQMLFPFVSIVIAVYVIAKLRSSPKNAQYVGLAGCAILAALLSFSQGGRANQTLTLFYDSQYCAQQGLECGAQQGSVAGQCLGAVSDWQHSDWLPSVVERRLKALAGQRCLMFSLLDDQDHPAVQASIIERDFLPRSGAEMLAYIPRAMAIGVLSPMPAAWFQRPGGRVSTFYTVIPVEAALVYVGIVGLVLFVIKNRTYSLIAPVLLAVYAMTVYGMATPFIGGLYRYRYPFWEIVLCFGVAALWSLMHRRMGTGR